METQLLKMLAERTKPLTTVARTIKHPASKVALPKQVEEMIFGKTMTGNLEPSQVLDIGALEGKTLVPAFGDRTWSGGLLGDIEGVTLEKPVTMQGGADFMRTHGTGLWASEPAAMESKARAIRNIGAAGEDPVLVYTAMGSQAGDFSHMMADAVMGQIPAAKITKKAAKNYDTIIKKTVDPNWPGILSPDAATYVGNMPGTARRELWQEMNKGIHQEAGFPDVGVARLAITDPRLVHARPFDTGLTIGRANPEAPIIDRPNVTHETYSAQIPGEYMGGLLQNIPGELVWRDFFGSRRAAGASKASDQRSFMMTPSIKQKVTPQMVDEISRYLELAQGGLLSGR